MKKLLGIMLLSFILLTFPAKSGSIGKGELKLSSQTVEWFIKYIKLSGNNKPGTFLVTLDGVGSFYFQCPHGDCRDNSKYEIKECEKYYNKECAIFARKRTVKWKNGINTGKKESRFKSKWSDAEIKAKLSELGFFGNVTQKIEKIQTSQTNDANDITKQLTNLIEMYESGSISKEEFEKAKKRILD